MSFILEGIILFVKDRKTPKNLNVTLPLVISVTILYKSKEDWQIHSYFCLKKMMNSLPVSVINQGLNFGITVRE